VPFVGIYMSAEIINELTATRDIRRLAWLVVLTVVASLIVATGTAILDRVLALQKARFGQKEQLLFCQKALTLDYMHIEDAEVLNKRRRIDAARTVEGHGIWMLMDLFERIADSVLGICFSAALTASLFVTTIARRDVSVGPFLFPLAIAGLIFLYFRMASFSTGNIAKKANALSRAMLFLGRVQASINAYQMGKDVRIYRQDGLLMSLFEKGVRINKEAYFDYYGSMFRYRVPMHLSQFALNAVVYAFVCLNALRGLFGIGNAVRYIAAMQRFLLAINSLNYAAGDFRHNTPFVEDYFEFLDIGNQMTTTGSLKPAASAKGYGLEFRHAWFRYPGSEAYALKNVSLRITPGERLAVVGQNGSGKTTLIKLLCRLYDPTEGEVWLDGVNIKQYDYDQYLRLFSVVFQDFKLFSFSLGQNVASAMDYDGEKAVLCLKKVGLGPRLAEMGYGLETPLYKDFDARGVEVSGGEAQKIALARALYKDAPIIVLDEPTAALDPIAEAEIYARFAELVLGKTAIYISHRLSSCRFCDRVAVFDEGQLVQLGQHDELLQDPAGKYSALWQAQAGYYQTR
jgi:ATP-binding cassette subfamily B protein